MVLKSYLVAPSKTGLENNIKPWLLPEDAFETLEDAYVFRGRVRKRFGSSLIGTNDLNSRLRINLGDTDGAGGISGTVPGSIFKVGQMFSIGSEVFTVQATGTPVIMLTTGSATTRSYDTSSGGFVIAGASATTPCYFYPAEPVMGLRTRELTSVNFEDTIAFDTQFAYERTGGAWERIVGGADSWTGSNSQFFWSINYRGANPYETYFYTANFNRADHIRYLPQGSSTWTDLQPQLDSGATRFLDSCRILVGYKDRLVALNCLETDGGGSRTFPSRCRFSQNGDPTAATTSWLDDTRGRGGYIDAPTQQQIITADILKDRLIVYFERSTWELIYTGYPDAPFRWQQLNNELGCESTFSVIGFDSSVLGVGNVGVHACNGVNVSRIDEKIPDEIYKIHNGSNGPERVYGIRDYVPQLVYWAFPSEQEEPTFPNRVLVYNYEMNTWAFFNDSFTCFGYFQKETDLTWATAGTTYPTWSSWETPWDSGRAQSAFPDIIGGNQEGFVLIINPDNNTNGQSLYITNMTPGTSTLTIVDHNLELDDYIRIEDAQGITSLNDVIVRVQDVTDSDNIVIDTAFTGTYTGGGKARRISNINIVTKQYNPGTPVGQQFNMPYVDFLLSVTEDGEVSLDYLLNASLGDTVQDTAATGALLGDNTLRTRPEDNQLQQISSQYVWHRYYVQAQGSFIQLRFSMSEDQMKDFDISSSAFEMQAMLLYAEPQGRITG